MVAAQGIAAAEGGREGEDHTEGVAGVWEAAKAMKSGKKCMNS